MKERIKIIMDVDTGADDALALLFAAKCKAVELLAVGTVAGNVGLGIALRNTLAILELAKCAVPVAAGASGPLSRGLKGASNYHGENGLNGVILPEPKTRPESVAAARQIIELSGRFPGEIALAPTGPLTNVALALTEDPGLASRLKEIILMGGAAFCPGNVGRYSEFNIAADPEAAAVVFGSGAKITMVGLDVTEHTVLTPSDLPVPPSEDPVYGFVVSLLAAHMRQNVKRGIVMHDPLAIGCAADRTLIKTLPCRIDIETKGELTTGMTVVERRNGKRETPNVNVAVEADSGRFIGSWVKTVLG